MVRLNVQLLYHDLLESSSLKMWYDEVQAAKMIDR